MARRPGIFRRDSDSGGDEDDQSAGAEAGPTPEDAAKEPRRVGRFMAWLGYGPESEPQTDEPGTEVQASAGADPASLPGTQEWQVEQVREQAPEDPPPEVVETEAAPTPENETDPEAEEPTQPPASDAGGEVLPQEPAPRRGDTEDRIRVAAADAADAADAAEQRSIEEILALEEDLERAKVEAASKLEELEGRLTGTEERAANAEREAQEARAKVADLERARAQAEERAESAAAAARKAPPSNRPKLARLSSSAGSAPSASGWSASSRSASGPARARDA